MRPLPFYSVLLFSPSLIQFAKHSNEILLYQSHNGTRTFQISSNRQIQAQQTPAVFHCNSKIINLNTLIYFELFHRVFFSQTK